MRNDRDAPVPDEVRFDALLAAVLQGGALIAAAIVACGGVIYLKSHAFLPVEYHAFTGEPDMLRSIGGIVAAARGLSGRGLIQLGLLVLIATPVARVVLSAYLFVRERDWLYVWITGFVLMVLAYSLARA